MKTKLYPLILLFLSIFYINAVQAHYQFPIEINNKSNQDIIIGRLHFNRNKSISPDTLILRFNAIPPNDYHMNIFHHTGPAIIGEIDMECLDRQESTISAEIKIPYFTMIPHTKIGYLFYQGTLYIESTVVFNNKETGFSLEIQKISMAQRPYDNTFKHLPEIKIPLTYSCENGKIVINMFIHKKNQNDDSISTLKSPKCTIL